MISEQEIAAKAEHINAMPFVMKYGVINDFIDMVEGGNPDGIRDEYYSDWTTEELSKVLALVDQKDT